MSIKKMTDLSLAHQRVLIREDLNVPIKNGVVASDARLLAVLPTLQLALKKGAKVMVMSHLGRPEEGLINPELSLAPVAKRLSELLQQEVIFKEHWLDGIDLKDGEIAVCENVRFNKGEKNNDEILAKQMASLCDIFVMDAFATAHRAEASTCGVAKFAPIACAGPLLMSELEHLEKVTHDAKHPIVAIVGGSKVSTKLTILDTLSKKVDYLIIGGGIANTFIAAEGYEVGKSLYEPDLIDEAERLIALSKAGKLNIPLPIDVIVADKMSADAESYERAVDQVDEDEKILDIGPETVKKYQAIIAKAKTILWNGPVGAFEIDQFSKGTQAIGHAIADSDAFSVAGGGDTLAAIEMYDLENKISYVSTGGGAFLQFIEGKPLPGVEALKRG